MNKESSSGPCLYGLARGEQMLKEEKDEVETSGSRSSAASSAISGGQQRRFGYQGAGAQARAIAIDPPDFRPRTQTSGFCAYFRAAAVTANAQIIRAATNVRTFEYYSFEIFTNELFLRTNVRWRPLVCFWRTHCGAKLASAAALASRLGSWEPCTNGATLEILRWRLSMSCPGDQQRKKQ